MGMLHIVIWYRMLSQADGPVDPHDWYVPSVTSPFA